MNSENQKTKIESLKNDFKKAVENLKEALGLDPTRIHKDATIQRFEYCFELGWKLLQELGRYKGFDVYGPRDSIRNAARLGFITEPDKWLEFLEARNLTTHIYKEHVADQVYNEAKDYPALAEEVIEKANKMLLEH